MSGWMIAHAVPAKGDVAAGFRLANGKCSNGWPDRCAPPAAAGGVTGAAFGRNVPQEPRPGRVPQHRQRIFRNRIGELGVDRSVNAASPPQRL